MQRYVIRDKGFSSTDGFVILDQTDRELYRADGKNWTLSREFMLKSAEGAELLHMKQKLFSMVPTYTITRAGSPCATIKKAGARYSIDVPGQHPIQIERSKAGMEYTFKRDDRPIANVARKLVSLTENATIDIETSEDAELILASMVAIYDMKKH